MIGVTVYPCQVEHDESANRASLMRGWPYRFCSMGWQHSQEKRSPAAAESLQRQGTAIDQHTAYTFGLIF
jgi:hypothetical protein